LYPSQEDVQTLGSAMVLGAGGLHLHPNGDVFCVTLLFL